MEKNQLPIKIRVKLSGGHNSIIPLGVVEDLTIEVIDGKASYHFNDSKITKLFAQKQTEDLVESVYVERLKKAICRYPGLNKEQIAQHIKDRLLALGAKK